MKRVSTFFLVSALSSCGLFPSDHSIYEGLSKRQLSFNSQGQAVIIYEDGKYIGQVVNNIPAGIGRFEYSDGSEYEGEVKEGVANGKGELLFKNGNRYVGEFTNGHQHGFGSLEFKDGSKYVGNFTNGSQRGTGTYFYNNGDILKGNSNGDTASGTLRKQNGDSYKGSFLNGLLEGHGEYMKSSGELLVGSFKNGFPYGFVTSTVRNQSLTQLWRNNTKMLEISGPDTRKKRLNVKRDLARLQNYLNKHPDSIFKTDLLNLTLEIFANNNFPIAYYESLRSNHPAALSLFPKNKRAYFIGPDFLNIYTIVQHHESGIPESLLVSQIKNSQSRYQGKRNYSDQQLKALGLTVGLISAIRYTDRETVRIAKCDAIVSSATSAFLSLEDSIDGMCEYEVERMNERAQEMLADPVDNY